MTKFIDFILDLFKRNGYKTIAQPKVNKPIVLKHSSFDDYWMITCDIGCYNNQATLFEWYKDEIQKKFPLAIKNTSLLLLINKDDQKNIDDVEIENDPLYFKKYVLVYDSESHNELQNKINQLEGKTFEGLIMDENTFNDLKQGEAYADLLYSIVHKLPFIPIKMGVHKMEDQHLNMFSTEQASELYHSIKDNPMNDNSELDRFIENFVNETENEEH